MKSISEVLKDSEQIVLAIDTRLDNTAISEWGFEDFNAGFLPNCGLDLDIVVNNNSRVLITAGQARNSGGSDVVEAGIQIRTELKDNFSGGTSLSLGKLKLSFRPSQAQLHRRDWDNRDLLVSAGGLVDGEELRYPDYPVYFQGISNGYDHDESSMQVSMSLGSKELSNIFPKNTFSNGNAVGEVVPLLYGTVTNYKPVDLGNGLYQFFDNTDGEDVREVTAAYNNGASLTLDISADVTATPATGEYITNGYQIKVNPSDTMNLTIDVLGPTIISLPDVNDMLMNIIGDIVYKGCEGRVPLTYLDKTGPFTIFDTTEKIGYVFDQQKTVRQHLEDILTPLDMYFVENKDDNGITVRRRYNGQFLDVTGEPNVRDAFYFDEVTIVEGGVRRIRTEPRPQATRVFYNRNWSPLTTDDIPAATRLRMRREYEKTLSYISPRGTASSRDIKTALVEEADATALAIQSAARDGARNERYSLSVHDIGHGITVGDVGVLEHELLPENSFAEIRQITEDTVTRRTSLTVVIYE